MKACTIYKTNREYKIITVYQRESEILHQRDPVFIIPITSSNEKLSKCIFNSLNSSGTIKESELITTKELLKLIKAPSFKSLYKNSTSCMIFLSKGKLELIPYKEAKDRGLEEVNEDKKTIDYTKENESLIITTIVEMLNRKY